MDINDVCLFFKDMDSESELKIWHEDVLKTRKTCDSIVEVYFKAMRGGCSFLLYEDKEGKIHVLPLLEHYLGELLPTPFNKIEMELEKVLLEHEAQDDRKESHK